MQVKPVSCISDFWGSNLKFKDKLVEQEKNEPNGGRSFAEIFADAKSRTSK